MFRHRDKVQPMTYGSALTFLRVMQRRVGVSDLPGLHGIRVTGNNLSRNGNGEELTQIHGGWLSTAGRSRYDRFSVESVLAIPSRMLGRPPPNSGGPAAPRPVLRYAHLERTGPQAGDAAHRLVLPPDLVGAVLTGRAAPAAAPAPAAPPVFPHAAPRADHELDADARGSGVLLPEGYTCVERVAAKPRGSGRSRTWKEYSAPDGTRLPSRAAAWRHAAAADVMRGGGPSAGVAEADREFRPVAADASPGSALSDGDVPLSDGDVPLSEFVGGRQSIRLAASLSPNQAGPNGQQLVPLGPAPSRHDLPPIPFIPRVPGIPGEILKEAPGVPGKF